jgi:hypothetical protein
MADGRFPGPSAEFITPCRSVGIYVVSLENFRPSS